MKDELLQLLVDRPDDYNLCANAVADSLRPFASEEDAKKVASWIDAMEAAEASDEEDIDGFICGSGALLSDLDVSIIRRHLLPPDGAQAISNVRGQVLCECICDRGSTAALDLAGELLLRGVDESATTIYFIVRDAKSGPNLSWASFTPAHVSRLKQIIRLGDGDRPWALRALRSVCAAREDLRDMVNNAALAKRGIEKVALLYCVSPTDVTPVFEALKELLSMDKAALADQQFGFLEQMDLDWTGRESLLVRLLQLRDARLARALLGSRFPPDIPHLGTVEIGPIEWWFEWMVELARNGEKVWLACLIGGLLVFQLRDTARVQIIAEFNRPASKYRPLLLYHVMPHVNDITTDAFTEETISFLLADLRKKHSVDTWYGNLIGIAATERFVAERLLPLLVGARGTLASNLREVLEIAGVRHGRRYVGGPNKRERRARRK